MPKIRFLVPPLVIKSPLPTTVGSNAVLTSGLPEKSELKYLRNLKRNQRELGVHKC